MHIICKMYIICRLYIILYNNFKEKAKENTRQREKVLFKKSSRSKKAVDNYFTFLRENVCSFYSLTFVRTPDGIDVRQAVKK